MATPASNSPTDVLNAALANILRYDPALVPSQTLTLADGTVVPNPLYVQQQNIQALIAKVQAGTITLAQALDGVVKEAVATTSVANLSYSFFTGKTPTAAGLDYLVGSPTNPNDLNDPYYVKFAVENRYINFAVNLGKNGEGAGPFASDYGALSLNQSLIKAYTQIFGAAPDAAKIAAILTPERIAYFAAFGLDGPDGLGTKSAMVGWLIGEAAKANTGPLAESNARFLADLADGTAKFNVELTDAYKPLPSSGQSPGPDTPPPTNTSTDTGPADDAQGGGSAPTQPVDTNAAANSVVEGAAAGTSTGLTVSSVGTGVTYQLTGDSSGGGFKLDPVTHEVVVANGTKLDYETAGAAHSHTVTVQATGGDGLTASQSFVIKVADQPLANAVDADAAPNAVAEGAAAGTPVGVTAQAFDPNGPSIFYALPINGGGAFKIDAATGVISVADPTKLDYETAASHTVVVQATTGGFSSSQSFAIAVTDVVPTAPADVDTALNRVAEGAVVGTAVGVTAFATDPNGPATTYSLTNSAGGAFKIDAATGVVTVADAAKVDFESSGGGYTITVKAQAGSSFATKDFAIGVTDVALSAVSDANAGVNSVAEGAAANTTVGLTALANEPNGPAIVYSLTSDANGAFKIDAGTGVVSVNDPTKIDFETSGGSLSVTVKADAGAGGSVTQAFNIAVTDVAVSAAADADAGANTVAEGAASGTVVGVTALATDPNGPAATYSLTNSAGGAFKINATSGVVTVDDPTKLDFETASSHTITVKSTAGASFTTQDFTIAVADVAPTAPTDSNAAADSVTEGAAAGSLVGITAASSEPNGPAVSYSLTNSASGAFAIDSATGVVTVADASKIDFETSSSLGITVKATSGALSTSQNFTVAVTNVPLSTPSDANAAANSVVEGAAAGTAVGITASASDPNGPTVSYALTDNASGAFAIDGGTGVVTVADPTKIDFESSGGSHSLNITVKATAGASSTTQSFAIGVTDVVLSAVSDANAGANSVAEGAAANATVGLTALANEPNGPAIVYSLTNDANGAFKIDAGTGVVSVNDPTKIDFETSGGSLSVTVKADAGAGGSVTQAFNIAVTDVAVSAAADADAGANTVAEGAASGTVVGVTALATDPNGPAATYSLTNSAGGAFKINATSGVVTVDDPTKLDFETASSHTITVKSTAGASFTTQDFTIAVADVAPTAPTDSNAAADSVTEGAAAGSLVGITAASSEPNGPAVSYSLTNSASGAFAIDSATGVVTVADASKIDFETSSSLGITVKATSGALSTSQNFTVAVTNVPLSTPSDANAAANSVVEGAAAGTAVGITASASDPNGPTVSYALTDNASGAFAIDGGTGVVTVADPTKIDFESSGGSHSLNITVKATAGASSTTQSFAIGVTDVVPTTPTDTDATANKVGQLASTGTLVGVTASSTDPNGPAVAYSIATDTSGGGFSVDATTGVVKVADGSKITYSAAAPSYDVTVKATAGASSSQQTFKIDVNPNDPPVAKDDAVSATEAGGQANGTAGSNPAGNVVLGTGSAGAVADTDAQDATTALLVTAVRTGAAAGTGTAGTLGVALAGAYGSLTLNADGSYSYVVDQSNATVQALNTGGSVTDNFAYTIKDTGALTATATLAVTVGGANDAPVAVAGHTLAYTENGPAAAIDAALTLTDVDSANLTGALVSISNNYQSSQDVLGFTNTAKITGAFNSANGNLTLSGTATVAEYEAALRTVTYANTSENPATAARTVVFQATDAGGLSSQTVQGSITVAAVNDAPVATAGHSLAYTENDPAKAVDAAFTVTDVDSANLTSATVQITGAFVSGQDVLGFTNQNGITGSFNATNGTLSLSGSSSVANYQTAIASVTYVNTSENPSGADRTVTYIVNDGAASSAAVTGTIKVTPVNDAPVAANFTFNGVNSATANTTLVINDTTDGAPSTSGAVKLVNVSGTGGLLGAATDVDGPGPLTIVGVGTGPSHGTVTIEADGDFVYKPTPGYTGSDTFTYKVSDQNPGTAGIGTGTVTLNVIAPKVWYVDAAAAAGGDGTSSNPFNSLAALNGVGNNGATTGDVDGDGDIIFVVGGTYSSGITLENNQQLISQSNGLRVADGGGIGGMTTLVAASGPNAVINGTVQLASGNTIQGIDFGNTTAGNFSLIGSGVGTATIGTVTRGVINNTTGGGLDIGGLSNVLNMDFDSVTTSGSAYGVSLLNSSGSFTARGGTISNATTSDVRLNGGNLTFNLQAAINDTNGGVAVDIGQLTGGTQSFSGAISSSGGGAGVNLTSNTGATVNFTGGMTLSTGSSAGFSATGGGTVNVSGTNNITTSGAGALNLNGVTVGGSGATFASVTSSGAGGGVSLTNVSTGAVTIQGGSVSSSNGTAFAISGGNGNVSYGGAVADAAGALSVSVGSHTAGTVSFTGAINDSNDAGGGISLTSNTGATINFSGGMTLNTTTGAGFTATGGGTVNVTGTNHLTTTTGTALTITNTTIGSSNVNFQDISANGAANGILLNSTGSSGGLIVTGTGSTAGTGGTIQNTTGRGASFISSNNVSLSNMNFTNAGTTDLVPVNSGLSTGDNLVTNAAIHLQTVNTATLNRINVTGGAEQGINGNAVSNLTLSNSSITSAGNAADEDGFHFYNLTGTSAITNTTFTNLTGDDNLIIQNQSGTLNLTITGGSASGGGTQLGSGYLFGIRGTANATINISGVTSRDNFSGGIVADAFDTSTMNITVDNSTSRDNNDQISISASQSSTVTATITNDIITSSVATKDFTGVGLLGASFATAASKLTAQVSGNTITIGNNVTADALVVNQAGGGTLNASITNNTFDYAGSQRGILLQAGTDGNGALKAIVTGNNMDIKLDGTSNAVNGILAQSAVTGPGNTASLDAKIGGAGALSNTFTHSLGGTLSGSGDIRVRQRNDGTFNLDGYGGSSKSAPSVGTYLDGRNGEVTASSATIDSVGFTGNATPPLTASLGGVQASSPTPGETHLTQTMLDTMVSTAAGLWAKAGAAASQIAKLLEMSFSVSDLLGATIGEQTPGHVVVDVDAAGHGWFVDQTPGDSSEFAYTANAGETHLFADPSSPAAGHLDLLTTVLHEMGHQLGLIDQTGAPGSVMYANLVDGERRLPTAADLAVLQLDVSDVVSALPVQALRVQEDASGTFATVQALIETDQGLVVADLGQIDGMHQGDGVIVTAGGSAALLHADWFV